MLATFHSWSYFYRNGIFLLYLWSLLHNLATCVPRIRAKASHLVLRFMYIFDHDMLADGKSCIVFVSHYSWTEILTH